MIKLEKYNNLITELIKAGHKVSIDFKYYKDESFSLYTLISIDGRLELRFDEKNSEKNNLIIRTLELSHDDLIQESCHHSDAGVDLRGKEDDEDYGVIRKTYLTNIDGDFYLENKVTIEIMDNYPFGEPEKTVVFSYIMYNSNSIAEILYRNLYNN